MIICVVGNAQSLLDKKDGEIIDKGDMVIRFNGGVVRDPKSQGTKTTHYAFSNFGRRCRVQNHLEELSGGPVNILHTRTPEFDNIKEYLKTTLQSKPSNGMIIVEYLKRNHPNDEIKIFGFDWKKTKTFYKKDRQERLLDKNHNPHAHDFDEERKYCLKLINELDWKLY